MTELNARREFNEFDDITLTVGDLVAIPISPARKVVELIRERRYDQINRWDVLNNLRSILSMLKNEGLYADWIAWHLQDLHDSAKDSL